MATHSGVLTWRTPGTGEPDGLPSMGSHRVGHDWSDLAAAADSILKFRDIPLPTKVHLVIAMVFPVVMSECECWTIKKAEHHRIDAFFFPFFKFKFIYFNWRLITLQYWCFELCHWRRLLRVPWTARITKPSIVKEISPEYSLEGLMLKLNLQYFGHLMQRTDSLERPWYWERLKVGGEGDNRGWDGWMASLTRWTWVWVNSGSWWWTGRPGMLRFTGSQRVGHDWATDLIWSPLEWTGWISL